ncbi:MAG: FAD-dependent thymidylate synthase [Tissierellia bacterium]|jgi:thymidylate synthase (FAD)|nr:FAD-dependent thymidylate synthase [Tissierellia bacterium]
MRVDLLSHTPDGEKLIAAAAKLCYSKSGVADLLEDMTDDAASGFLSMLTEIGHVSPVEHVTLTFGVEGVSRSLTHQLVRHRLASYSQQSQRYVKLDAFEYIVPPAIIEDPDLADIFTRSMQEQQAAYDQLVEGLLPKNTQKYLQRGFSEKEAKARAEKDSLEDARYVFPNACETKIIFTMNVRSLLHFITLRTCNRAQWEIRGLALEVHRLAAEAFPVLFQNAGPRCLHGPCPEGRMSCGRQEEVRAFFAERRQAHA